MGKTDCIEHIGKSLIFQCGKVKLFSDVFHHAAVSFGPVVAVLVQMGVTVPFKELDRSPCNQFHFRF